MDVLAEYTCNCSGGYSGANCEIGKKKNCMKCSVSVALCYIIGLLS